MDEIVLGGNINLVGFKDLDGSQMVVVKKIVGNYAKKMSEMTGNFENLSVTLKSVHKASEGSKGKVELHAKLMNNGTPIVSEVVDFNLYYGLDKVLGKIVVSIKK